MKNMNKLFAMVLAVVMILSLATTAFADDTNTITIKNSASGYTYVAYQVFSGILKDGDLTELTWGEDVDGDALLDTLQADYDYFDACVTAVDVAAVLNGKAKDAEEAKAFADAVSKNLKDGDVADTSTFADGKYTISVAAAGYYLVLNTAVPGATESAPAGSYTRYILKVAGNAEVSHKGTVPTVDKEIVDGTTTETGDYSIGDTISYKLTGTLPNNYADYTSYKYVFTDTMEAGLTYKNDAKVYVVNGSSTPVEVTSSFTITPNAETAGATLSVSCANLKAIPDVTIDASSKIVVEYTCVLNSNAVIGGEGNANEVYLTFSNNPNYDGTGTESTGDTPKDEVVVFTFELDVTKVDGVDNTIKLEGAKFKLQNSEDKWVTVDANGKVTGWVDNKDDGSVLTSDANGFFKIVGLEDGTYKLWETEAPKGYNSLNDPVVITIDSTYNEAGVEDLTIKVGESTTDGDTDKGIVSTIVENNSGATLPETGGIGTTLFYVFGGIMVMGAVVLLVTKKRMAA